MEEGLFELQYKLAYSKFQCLQKSLQIHQCLYIIFGKMSQTSLKSETDRLKMPNGAEYEGEVFENRPHGRGRMRYTNSQRYQGDFFQGMKEGKGKYYYQKGELYIGDWHQNKKHGKGQYFYKNGCIYTGDFIDNKKHGFGRIEEPNHSYYEGTFFMNNKDKTGIYYDDINKKKYSLVYDNGKLISQAQMPISQDDSLEKNYQEEEQKIAKSLKKTPSKKGTGERLILSEEVILEGELKDQKNRDYASHFENSGIKFGSSLKKQQKSTQSIRAQNFIDSVLLKKKVHEWGVGEVAVWLNQIGFGDCIQDFKENNIQGDSLLVLYNEDLKELGVSALGDRRILLRQIEFLRLVFKSQCVDDPIIKYSERQLTLDLVRSLQKVRQIPQGQSSSSSQSVSSQEGNDRQPQKIQKYEKNRGNKEKEQKKNKETTDKMSMQTKVSEYLEKKGIKLTFLISKQQIQIIEKIGKGGYGQVYLGKLYGQQVAVKKYIKKRGFRNKHIAHFIEEVQVINKLHHPCIVLYMGMCIYDNQYAMVTEFLSGGSLFDYLHKKKEKLSEEQLISFCKDVSLGMAYLHEKDVLHCDLKSSNLLIDQNFNIKLCDFGLSRINSTKNKKKMKNMRVGTPHWMAPQILRGGKYECPSDVYSFGILMWEMMTGRIPYKDYSTAQIIGMVGNNEKHHIGTPDYPNPTIIDIFLRTTQRDPSLRPSFKVIVNEIEQIEKHFEKKLSATME